MALLFLMFYVYRHRISKNYLFIPLIYMAIGMLTLIIGYNTPCCSGG